MTDSRRRLESLLNDPSITPRQRAFIQQQLNQDANRTRAEDLRPAVLERRGQALRELVEYKLKHGIDKVPDGAARARNPVSDTTQGGYGDYWTRRVPFLGGAADAGQNIAVMENLGHFTGESGSLTGRTEVPTSNPFELREGVTNADLYKDPRYDQLATFMAAQEAEGKKPFLRKVGDLASAIPGYGVEFAATGGVYSAGRIGGTKLAGKLTKDAAETMVTRNVGRAIGLGAQTAANPSQIASNTTRRMIDSPQWTEDQEGKVRLIVQEHGESILEALPRGFLDTYIEMLSERSGAKLAQGAGALAAPLKQSDSVKALQEVLARRVLLRTPSATPEAVGRVFKAGGFHGVLEELAEERLGEVLRGATGVEDDFGAIGDILAGRFGEGFGQLAVEAAAFAVPGGARAIGSGIEKWDINNQRERRKNYLEQYVRPAQQAERSSRHQLAREANQRYEDFMARRNSPRPPMVQQDIVHNERAAGIWAQRFPERAEMLKDIYGKRGTVSQSEWADLGFKSKVTAKDRANFAEWIGAKAPKEGTNDQGQPQVQGTAGSQAESGQQPQESPQRTEEVADRPSEVTTGPVQDTVAPTPKPAPPAEPAEGPVTTADGTVLTPKFPTRSTEFANEDRIKKLFPGSNVTTIRDGFYEVDVDEDNKLHIAVSDAPIRTAGKAIVEEGYTLVDQNGKPVPETEWSKHVPVKGFFTVDPQKYLKVSGKERGYTSSGLIILSATAATKDTLSHERLHFMKRHGVLDDIWDDLVDAAGANSLEGKKQEEAVANMVGAWGDGTTLTERFREFVYSLFNELGLIEEGKEDQLKKMLRDPSIWKKKGERRNEQPQDAPASGSASTRNDSDSSMETDRPGTRSGTGGRQNSPRSSQSSSGGRGGTSRSPVSSGGSASGSDQSSDARGGESEAVPGDTGTDRPDPKPEPEPIPQELEDRPAERDQPEGSTKINFRITEDTDLGLNAGEKKRVEQNFAAIRLVKQLRQEKRFATPEEQQVLVKYVGWGGLKTIFSTAEESPDKETREKWEREWGPLNRELKELLTKEEFAAARTSIKNAHYTAIPVVRGMWDAIVKSGFRGSNIVEPAIGSGHFFGAMPDSFLENAKLQGIEKDPITSEIARQLYQRARIQNEEFQRVKMSDNSIDLFISNVPFINTKVTDVIDRDLNNKANLHDYFFIKAGRKTRPGGLVMFITSNGTMDKVTSKARKLIAEQGLSFVGAVRLPSTAFKKNANTEVVTDVIVMQKVAEGTSQDDVKMIPSSSGMKVGNQTFNVNEHYHGEGGKYVIGDHSAKGSMYSADSYTVEPFSSHKTPEAVASEMADSLAEQMEANLNKAILDAESNRTESLTHPEEDLIPLGESEVSDAGYREGSVVIREGEPFFYEFNTLTPLKPPGNIKKEETLKKWKDKVRGLSELLDHALRLSAAQRDPGSTDEALAEMRTKLNEMYDSHVKRHGFLNAAQSVSAMRDDYEAPLLLSLEEWDADNKKAVKSAIFHRRTERPWIPPTQAGSVAEAVGISLSIKGKIDIDYMGELTTKSADEVIEEAGDLIFHEPGGHWVESDRYLSGDVVGKLEKAKAAAAKDLRYVRNVEALQEVQPEPTTDPDTIVTEFNSPWIPHETIQQYIAETFNLDVTINRIDSTGKFVFAVPRHKLTTREVLELGTEDRPALDIIERLMNLKSLKVFRTSGESRRLDEEATIAAEQKAEELKTSFLAWLWGDEDRKTEMLAVHDRKMKRFRAREYDGSHLVFPGISDTWTPRPHQRNAVWRFLSKGNTLLSHQVGTGKTITLSLIAMEAKRTGRANKPLIVVPKSILNQFASDFKTLYPNAKVLLGGFDKKSRARTMQRVRTTDWDAVFVTYEQLGMIPVSKERQRDFIEREVAEYEEKIREERRKRGTDNRNYVSQLEGQLETLRAKLTDLLQEWDKDQGPTFEDLGLDMLLVDEAHNFKNLAFTTGMGREVMSLGKTDGAYRTTDLFLKSQYINEMTGERNIVFSTGTPVSNTMGEVFHMQRYLQPSALETMGIRSFDGWVGQFAQPVDALESNVTGSAHQSRRRLTKFRNEQILSELFGQISDNVLASDVKDIVVPKLEGGAPQYVEVPRTAQQKAYSEQLDSRIDDIRAKRVAPDEDNMLVVMKDGAKSSLDMRLVNPNLPFDPDSKVGRAAEEVLKIHFEEEHMKRKATQVIWLDQGVPGGSSEIDLYDDMKRLLVEGGIPANEIAFIHDAKNDNQRLALFKKLRKGEKRIIIGSTGKMSEGVNIQDRLIAAHHLDAPGKPAQVEQRDGRIIRQGNLWATEFNKPVKIIRYVTAQSFDLFNWQALDRKQTMIQSFLSGQLEGRLEDLDDTIDAETAKAISIGNPLVVEKLELDRSIRKLSIAANQHARNQQTIASKRRSLPSKIESVESALKELVPISKEAQELRQSLKDTLVLTVDGESFEKLGEAGEKILAKIDPILAENRRQLGAGSKDLTELMKLGDFTVGFRPPHLPSAKAKTHMEDANTSFLIMEKDGRQVAGYASTDKVGIMTRILNLLEKYPVAVQNMKDELDSLKAQHKQIKSQKEKPFPNQDELDKQRRRLAEVNLALSNQSGNDGGTTREGRAEGFFGGFTFKVRKPTIAGDDQLKLVREEVDRRVNSAFGRARKTFTDKLTAAAKEAPMYFRAQKHIPNTPEFGAINEVFRLMKEIPTTATEKARSHVAEVLEDLHEDKPFKLFSLNVILNNLAASVLRGEPLRFGYQNIQEVLDDQAEKNALANDPESKAVKDALEKRARYVSHVVEQLTDRNLLPQEALENPEEYYHQEVLSYVDAGRKAGQVGPQKRKAGFQKARVKDLNAWSSTMDYNTNYIEAETAWMTDAYIAIGLHDSLAKLEELGDISPRLKAEAKAIRKRAKKRLEKQANILTPAEIKDLEKAAKTKWKDLLPDTHDTWQPEAGHIMYVTVGLNEKVAAEILMNIDQDIPVNAKDLRRVFAMGRKKKELALPVEVVNQLKMMERKPEPTAIGNLVRWIMNRFKQLHLISPWRILAHNARNMLGDNDKLLAGLPSAWKHVPRAFAEIKNYNYQQKPEMSPELKIAVEHGVTTASMISSEMPDGEALKAFSRFYKNQGRKGLGWGIKTYLEWAYRFTTFRENILRYAAFLRYKEILDSGEALKTFGTAKAGVVETISKELGSDVAAAHLARELIGDYSNLTVFGQMMRAYAVPFYSWMEINGKHYPRLAINAIKGGKDVGGPKGLLVASILFAQMTLTYAAMWMWNNFIFDDEEDLLTDEEQASAHLILGKDPVTGETVILRNTSALGDFLEWGGVNTMLSRSDDLLNNQMEVDEVAVEVIKDPVAKLGQGLGPHIKGLAEFITAQSAYPDFFRPRPEDRDIILANQLGLRSPYKELKGQILNTGERGDPGTITNMLKTGGWPTKLIGTSDPKRNALYEMYELTNRFNEKDEGITHRADRDFRSMRVAAWRNDQKAFNEAARRYIRRKENRDLNAFDSFERAIERIDPLTRVNIDQREMFQNQYLTNAQRKKLDVARIFALDTRDRMIVMWQNVADDYHDEMLDRAAVKMETLSRERPGKLTPAEARQGVTYQEKYERWKANNAAAAEWLERHNVTEKEAQEAYVERQRELGRRPRSRNISRSIHNYRAFRSD